MPEITCFKLKMKAEAKKIQKQKTSTISMLPPVCLLTNRTMLNVALTS
ncbi:hypothetical protein CCACVL1_12936 [Corchorus capsularis]|uniref:Uncharacterized protein n=1 Tax=Corchorus capsularis TaxID=210143 RepID=A0A1R3ID35_COCAP|nr:hypothetical protein CCACVL1_12936 [Corchorus capsularis]